MAKYLYTHGKRKGKVYQEFYYTLNGQQIVNKKTFYCPVNTKWLSRVEFREYILQVIRDYYPNYLVVDELPEQLEPHIIYFLKHVNEDESVYYDVYVYFNEEQKQIVFKGVDPSIINEITQVINDIKTKSLKNVYNTTLSANKLVATDSEGCLSVTTIHPDNAKLVIDKVPTYALKYVYNKTVTGRRVMVSDTNGYIQTSSINVSTAQNVIDGVDGYSLKNIYYAILDADRVIVSDGDGYLKASGTTYNTLDVTLSGIRTKALANVYNSYLSANKNVITDGNGRLSYANMPHLYMHYIHYDRGGTGEVSFVIYNNSSTSLTTVDIYSFLDNISCNTNWKLFPAAGACPNGYMITGIYASTNSSGSFIDRGFTTVAYNGTTMYEHFYTNYNNGITQRVVTIF